MEELALLSRDRSEAEAEAEQTRRRRPLYEAAGFLSRLTFSWLDPLLLSGSRRRLELRHIPPLSSPDAAESAFDELSRRRSNDAIASSASSASSSPSSSISREARSRSKNAIASSASASDSSPSSGISREARSRSKNAIASSASSSDSSPSSSISREARSRSNDAIASDSSDSSPSSSISREAQARSGSKNAIASSASSSASDSPPSSSISREADARSRSKNAIASSSSSVAAASPRPTVSRDAEARSRSKNAIASSSSSSRSLIWCLAATFRRQLWICAFCAGIHTCASYVGPFLINDFVSTLSGTSTPPYPHYLLLLVSLFFAAKLVESIAQRHWYFGAHTMGLRARASMAAMAYSKGLALSRRSQIRHSHGELMNLLGVDIHRIADFSIYLHELWLLPLHICLSLSILYMNLGPASQAALAATAAAMLANLPFSKLQERFQAQIMEAKDARTRLMSEVLRSMKVLKLHAWEMRYLERVESLRQVEYGCLSRFLFTQAAALGLFWGAPVIVAMVTFGSCMLMEVPLTTGRVLSALATLRIMQEPIRNLPDLLSMLAQTKVSLDRIERFLGEEELQVDAVAHARNDLDHEAAAVEFHDAVFSWEDDDDDDEEDHHHHRRRHGHGDDAHDQARHSPVVRVSDLRIERRTRVAVCGMVGAGKSSFLSCILGEIPRISGHVQVRGTVAYVAQSPWIQTGKVVDNILFRNPMDRQKYEAVLNACALVKDLELFSHGDGTEIGEKGINLSGGQKQRIQLARAIYDDADIYILDDPFSAVDAHTGMHLFKECILGALAAKTVIYATNQVEFLPAADLILVLRNGEIVESGTYKELQVAGTEFIKLTGTRARSLDATMGVVADLSEESLNSIDECSCRSKEDAETISKEELKNEGDAEVEVTKPEMAQLVEEEKTEIGEVSMLVYWHLMRAAYGGALVPVILVAQTMFQCLQIASNYWIAWATPKTVTEEPAISTKHMLFVYVVLSFGSAACVLVRTFSMAAVTLKTGQNFFRKMLHSIFHASMSFLDSTPTGRILNRASGDQSALDLEVSLRLGGVVFSFIQLVGIVAVICQAEWELVWLFIPVLSACIWLQRYYVSSARELARLVGVHKSPILQHFGETITGASTIRGFNKQHQFMKRNLELIDHYSRPLLHSFAAMEWLCFRLDFLTNCVFTISLLFIISLPEGAIDASVAGLAVTYGLNLNIIQSWVTWNLCNLENKIISVERIQQYTCIPSEAPLVIPDSRPPKDWPSTGTIEFIDLKVRYGPNMPFVLHGITCTFSGGKKIGIVGRTGSGKSTLIQTLFRLVEPTEGKILIDGLNVTSIGLHDLRSSLSIIPQDPTMFEGSIRTNLDPLGEHTEEELWQVLEKSQLDDVVRTKDKKLDAIVTENGENWSVGQRQLICLARVLLRKASILVLDEATASVDSFTDGVIQRTIKAEFANQTVVAVAHRIPTVVNSDSILLLSEGRIVEYDHPTNLLKDESSSFSKLVTDFYRRS